jgi:signal transduction histidine kinase/CheY-like chemotaxis protein
MPLPEELLLTFAACAAFLALGLLASLLLVRRLREVRASLQEAEKALHASRAHELALRRADGAKDEFIAMLGHELRNPLNALLAAAHMLERGKLADPLARQAGGVVGRQARQMTRLIEDLLDVNRIVRGKVSLSRQPLDLAQAVEKAVGGMRVAGRLAKHDVQLALQPVCVRADEARVEQMIANLVGNAVKYTPGGGKVQVELRRDGDQAVLRVRDSGIGMAVELTAKVFDLFVQGEGSQRRGGGLGIGLTLVRHLAELHGGKVFAASSGPGEGSVFTLSLPAIDAAAGPQGATAVAFPAARHRILLVEDNAEARTTMHAALELDGHRVFQAADGGTGLRAVALVKPDVAVIDIGLPDVDGYEVAERLRATPEREKMVLIAVTGFERPDTQRRAREAGFDEYVAKPVAPEALGRLIDAAFSRRRSAGKSAGTGSPAA